jgi:hypothetical protein
MFVRVIGLGIRQEGSFNDQTILVIQFMKQFNRHGCSNAAALKKDKCLPNSIFRSLAYDPTF